MPADFATTARRIIAWFDKHARDLPWRRTKNPYAIWVSEIMLQQTQVKTVILYWERWMKLFPTVEALAHASEQSVLKAWEGLGYYSRARNLQKAARIICTQHKRKFPDDYDSILALPGVGRYTAGAICSIVFGEPKPIVDGNVARVLARFYGVPGDIKSPATQENLWRAADVLVKAADPSCSFLNQGLMELGATICIPREPLCRFCPLRDDCFARTHNRVASFPQRRSPAKPKRRFFLAFVVTRKSRILVRQRPRGGINGGLWEFPNFEPDRKRSYQEQVAGLLGFSPVLLEPFLQLKHSITVSRITLKSFRVEATGEYTQVARRLHAQWISRERLMRLPFSSAHAKIRDRALQQRFV